jgi:hypothetical protein
MRLPAAKAATTTIPIVFTNGGGIGSPSGDRDCRDKHFLRYVKKPDHRRRWLLPTRHERPRHQRA